jgi:hypothetical protein
LAGGFLDGRTAFTYHFLQGLWFPMLIDVKFLELKRRRWRSEPDLQTSVSQQPDAGA